MQTLGRPGKRTRDLWLSVLNHSAEPQSRRADPHLCWATKTLWQQTIVPRWSCFLCIRLYLVAIRRVNKAAELICNKTHTVSVFGWSKSVELHDQTCGQNLDQTEVSKQSSNTARL